MTVQYDRKNKGYEADLNRPRYACTRHAIEYGSTLCQSLTGNILDQFIARQVLTVLEPAALELSLSAAKDIQQQRAKIDQHWRHRLERSRYEADRAQRQYQAVEPENRLVARELERQWERALLDQHKIEEQYDRFQQEQPTAMTDDDVERIRTLSMDIPTLWQAPETTSVDRQTIVRHLIQQVTVTAPTNDQHVDLTIQWAGGFTSQHELIRPVGRYDQLDNYQQLVGRILELRRQGYTSSQVADRLNTEGFRPPKRRSTFNASMVRQVISRWQGAQRRPVAVQAHELETHEWWFTDLARHLKMPYPTLYSWVRRGWVNARQLPVAGGRWIVWADADELDRLKRLQWCPKSWHNQHQAAALTQPKPRPDA
jgi:hypothetical protein